MARLSLEPSQLAKAGCDGLRWMRCFQEGFTGIDWRRQFPLRFPGAVWLNFFIFETVLRAILGNWCCRTGIRSEVFAAAADEPERYGEVEVRG